jgi:chromate reductase
MEVLLSSLSLRAESFNLKLINIASQVVTTSSSTNKANIVDLNHYDIPYYNQEIEERGIPATVLALKEKIDQAKAIILASPEYNYSMPGHFKNTLDWLSRAKPQPFKNKPILLLSASPAMIGGNRGLWALRVPLEALGAFVFPNMFSLAQAMEALICIIN